MNNDETEAWTTLASTNPGAGAIALVGQLMQQEMERNYSIMQSLYDTEHERCMKLEAELNYLRPLALRFLQIRQALAPIETYE